MEKLVDIVHFLHLEIHEAFGSAGKIIELKYLEMELVKYLGALVYPIEQKM